MLLSNKQTIIPYILVRLLENGLNQVAIGLEGSSC